MAAVTKTPGRPFAILEGILPINTRQVPLDIVAGITLAALAIPEVMGYTKIAGMPVVTGLYTILIPMALFAIFGASRHLVVGADSATAAIMAAGLVGMAAIDITPVRRARRTAGDPHRRDRAAGPDRPTGIPGGLPVAHGPDRLPDGRRHPGRHRPDFGHARDPWRRSMGRSRSSSPTSSNCPRRILSRWRSRSLPSSSSSVRSGSPGRSPAR